MPASKLQRWIDLLAVLLKHRSPLTFLELARGVPAYMSDGSVSYYYTSDRLMELTNGVFAICRRTMMFT